MFSSGRRSSSSVATVIVTMMVVLVSMIAIAAFTLSLYAVVVGGPPGLDGADGAAGADGVDGVAGAAGVAGADGTVGTINASSIAGNGTIMANQFLVEGSLRYGTQIGTGDSFLRSQLWHFHSNDDDPDDSGGTYNSDGPILRLGALAADGDPVDVISEGAVFYGQNGVGGEINSSNFAFGRIKPLRFQLRESISGVQRDVFRTDGSELSWKESGKADPDNFKVDSGGVTITGDLEISTAGFGLVHSASATVTQATSLTTTVTSDSTSGRITLFSAIGAAAGAQFTVACTSVSTASLIVGSIVGCVTTTGEACSISFGSLVASTSFVVSIFNGDAANPTLGVPVVHYVILNHA